MAKSAGATSNGVLESGVDEPWFAVTDSEYRALQEGVALVDRSGRGKLALSGPDAAEFLHSQVTNDIRSLAPGQGCYAAFLTPKGMMLGDLRVLAVGDAEEGGASGAASQGVGELLLDTERITLQRLFDMVRRYRIGYQVELHKRTLQCGLLRLAGPGAGALLAELGALAAALPAHEHGHLKAFVADMPVRVIRCEHNEWELLFPSEERERLAATLCEAGATPVREAGFEVVRVERGIPRFGFELDERTIPQEAGLNERAVSFTKGCYVGQETVARLYYKGRPQRKLCGLSLERPVPHGAAVFLNKRLVGRLGSVALSPAHGPIALAILRRECEAGTALQIEAGDRPVAATVQPQPAFWQTARHPAEPV